MQGWKNVQDKTNKSPTELDVGKGVDSVEPSQHDAWFFLILGFHLKIYFKYSNFWHAKSILFLLQWNPREMLCFSFFYAASLVSISKKICSINLIGKTFVDIMAILQVVLCNGSLWLLLCILMPYCLLSGKSSKQRTNFTNLAQDPPGEYQPKKNKAKQNPLRDADLIYAL
jgi:hypothetical protein